MADEEKKLAQEPSGIPGDLPAMVDHEEELKALEAEIEKNIQVTQDYGEEQIQVLEGLEAVRKRPGM